MDFRRPIAEALEDRSAGICVRLDDTWPFRSRKALHLWQLPAFTSAAGLLNALRSRVTFDGDLAAVERASPSDKAWVANVRLMRREVIVATRHIAPRSFDTLQGYQTLELVSDRMFSIDLERQQPLAEGYAGYNEARQAIRAFLSWLLRQEIPDRGDAQKEFLRPISFNADQVKRFAERLELENVLTRGADVRGDAGELHIHGRMDGPRKAPLDTDVDWISNQVSGENDEYGYNWDYEHEDGYVEQTVVHLVCAGRPHLFFPRKTSRLATGSVIDELCADLKIM